MHAFNRLIPAIVLAGALAAGCASSVPSRPSPPALADSTDALRLDALRGRIDSVDTALARLVGERLAVAREIGDVKRAAGWPVVDTTRETAVVERFVRRAAASGVPEDVAADVIRRLILAARAEQ